MKWPPPWTGNLFPGCVGSPDLLSYPCREATQVIRSSGLEVRTRCGLEKELWTIGPPSSNAAWERMSPLGRGHWEKELEGALL